MRPTPHNAFKTAITNSELRFGLWLALGSDEAAEVCATAGFDWLLIDGEHGPYDLRSILSALRSVAAYDVDVVVRVPNHDPTVLKQILEIGATNILVPMIDTAQQARDVVRATRYPPAGERGVGSGLARSSRWRSYGDYLHVANDQICVIVQIESVVALDAVHDIADIDGVDAVFVGAADLAASMGHLGEPSHPTVRAEVERLLELVQSAGKPVGVLETDEALARRSMELGATLVAVGSDVGVLAGSLRSLVQKFTSSGTAAQVEGH